MKQINTMWKQHEVKGWKCAACGEELINPADAQKALEIEKAQKKNLLKVKLRRVGKSTIITVPRAIVEAEQLKEGQMLEWKIEGKKLVLTQ